MNYRQWKKNYKKKNGYNPPLVDDKRKQAKAIRMMLGKLSKTDVDKLRNSIIDGLSNACRIIGNAFNNMADSIKNE